jgi:tetratricopeptide (TPR) repeat protein
MYTQLLKETILEIEDDDKTSIKELVDYCRLQDDVSKSQIDKVEQKYREHTPIWWYTAPYFMYSMLNRALRVMDVNIILKMAFFIRHLHKHIDELYHEQQQSSSSTSSSSSFTVFRGQGLSSDDFGKMEKTLRGLMSFNNFLSTSRKRQVSLEFARPEARKPNSVGILFVMNIDPKVCATSSIPFADVTKIGYYKGKEEEILFTTHTIFRIDHIQRIEDKRTDRLWQVNLTLTGANDNHKLTSHIREDLSWTTGWSRLGAILIKLGEPSKAEQLYQILLDEKASSDEDRAQYNHQLGRVYRNMGEYSKALSSYERSLEILKIALPPNHPDLATSYNNIGNVYADMGEYSKALSSYERSLEICKIALPPNHPDLAQSYSNIGTVYAKMGEYSKALSYYEKDLEISQKSLPPNHPDLAASYNGIGLVYDNMGEYSKALSFHERSLEIKKIALPPNHPDLATSYNNIGAVYYNMGEYSKALSFYERSLEIYKITLSPNHPDLAASYNNIGNVYKNMGEYSKALSSYERSLEIHKIALSPNHPDLAASYNNIGNVYANMGEYSKALSYYEKAQQIWQKSLPPTHPHIALVKRNIENVKKKL